MNVSQPTFTAAHCFCDEGQLLSRPDAWVGIIIYFVMLHPVCEITNNQGNPQI
jgi:hypothetical protein